MAKEIEVKFDLLNKQEIVDFLENNAEFIKESNQLDIYYNLPHRDFFQDPSNTPEWLRLRKSDKGCAITYKDYGKNNQAMCTEFEEGIADIDNLEQIFKAIDIKEVIKVNKNRKIWEYRNITICIDTVDELGDFIELETVEEDGSNYETILKSLYNIKDELNIKTNGEDRKGYPYILLKNKGII